MKTTLTYRSFCWNFGTTSFRTKDFNRSIEEQLMLLHAFWNDPRNADKSWEGNEDVQTEYYDFLHTKGFIKGQAERKAKDARQKTSGLCELGLIDNNRRLTAPGQALLDICETNDFSSDNPLQIPKDSYLYMKQLLKTSNIVEDTHVRPFVLLLYLLAKLEYLTLDEFTYLLPLCVDKLRTEEILVNIPKLRKNEMSLDDIIINHLMSFPNYQDGLRLFLGSKVTASLICEVGMNRKSRNYDKGYFVIYKSLYDVFVKNNMKALSKVLRATKSVAIKRLWQNYLFDTTSEKAIKKSPEKHLKETPFSSVSNTKEFKETFYKTLHLLKAKSLLSDYMDLNRRYVKISDIILFEDGEVRIDLAPRHFFKNSIDEMFSHAFEESGLINKECELTEIFPCLAGGEQNIVKGINQELGTSITTIDEAREVVDKNRYERFKHLLDTKFTKDNLLILLNHFELRKDKEIIDMVTEDADIPTIFEYILAIIWYNISERKGRILDYMKLSLNADLLPKSHAKGGDADIVYEYDHTIDYPTHCLLIEATLSDDKAQRRMEMEPVSRHLGQHLIDTGNHHSYCVFIATYLDNNVLSDFRGRKNYTYYDNKGSDKYVRGMKIIPLNTKLLSHIVNTEAKYGELYKIFDEAYLSELDLPKEWYEKYLSIPITQKNISKPI